MVKWHEAQQLPHRFRPISSIARVSLKIDITRLLWLEPTPLYRCCAVLQYVLDGKHGDLALVRRRGSGTVVL